MEDTRRPRLHLRRDFLRPTLAQIALLRDAPTGFVVDAMQRTGALDWRIKRLAGHGLVVGPALTVGSPPRDNLAPYAALAVARPGDVLVIATGGCTDTSVAGDILIGMARNAGISAVVTDGLVRDLAGIGRTGIAVHACGVSPNSPWKNGPGTVGLPVTLGGMTVAAGDLVVCDDDGVVVVPAHRLATVAEALAAIRGKEADMEAAVAAGATCPPWVDELLREVEVRHG